MRGLSKRLKLHKCVYGKRMADVWQAYGKLCDGDFGIFDWGWRVLWFLCAPRRGYLGHKEVGRGGLVRWV